MKKIVLLLSVFLLSSCTTVKDYVNKEGKFATFSATEQEIASNLNCESIFKTDSLNSSEDEVFRCSGDMGDIYFEVRSKGNNSEKMKQAKIVWKKWDYELTDVESKAIASQFAAVFSRLYAAPKEEEFIDSYFNKGNGKFKYFNYDLEVKSELKDFYELKIATVNFR